MIDADALFRDGDLEGARAALVARARAAPDDARARMFLFQLLALGGEWDKAKGQLDALVRLSPSAQMLAVVYGQAIDAERVRAAGLAGRTPIPVLAGAGTWIDGVAAALGALGRGEIAEAEERRGAALDAAPDTPGAFEAAERNGRFDWIADADGWFGPSLEAIVAGQWGLLPFDAIETLTSAGPSDLRDTIWYPVEIALVDGRSFAGLLPARYPGSAEAADPRLRMAAATDWTADGRGLGQRLFVTSGDEEVGLLSLRRLAFGRADEAAA